MYTCWEEGVSGISKTTPGFNGSVLEDSADSHTHGYDYSKRKKPSTSAKENSAWGEVWRKPSTNSQGPLPVESLRTHATTRGKCCL